MKKHINFLPPEEFLFGFMKISLFSLTAVAVIILSALCENTYLSDLHGGIATLRFFKYVPEMIEHILAGTALTLGGCALFEWALL